MCILYVGYIRPIGPIYYNFFYNYIHNIHNIHYIHTLYTFLYILFLYFSGLSRSILKNIGYLGLLKNLNSGIFMFFNFSSHFFTFLKSKSVNLFEFIRVANLLLFRNVRHSFVWDNLRVLLGRIFVSSVGLPRNLRSKIP